MATGLVRKSGAKESRKGKMSEQKQILQATVKMYSVIFEISRKTLAQKLGKATGKLMTQTFEKVKSDHKTISFINIAEDGSFDFVNFSTLVDKIPEESRIHLISTGFSALLIAILDLVRSTIGNKQRKQIISQTIVETEETINQNADVLKKFGILGDFSRAIQI
jgi:hypothetical protein